MPTTKNANGQAFGPDGRLYAAATGSSQVLAYDADGKPTVIAEGIRGNDLVVRHDGGIYVTQPGGGGSPSQVWYINPQGEKRVVDTGLKFANGITLSPDQSLLVCRRLRQPLGLQLPGPAGWLARLQAEVLITCTCPTLPTTAGPTACGSIAMAASTWPRGWASRSATRPGRVNCIIPTPNGKVANLCFGGRGLSDTLRHLRRPRLQTESQG